MSKFTINNPAFLQLASNAQGVDRNPFYVEAIENETVINFPDTDSVYVSKNGRTYDSAPRELVLNSKEKIYIKFGIITADISSSEPELPRLSINKPYNIGGESPIIVTSFVEEGVNYYFTEPYKFSGSDVVDASNLIVLDSSDVESILPVVFDSLFEGCTKLENAPQLPSTVLYESYYKYMFKGCTSLVKAPELPATQTPILCYSGMFDGCTSLVNAPELPATTLSGYDCYKEMFKGCTSLVNAPELPATTLASRCYESMFKGCTSLVNAPELPATTLEFYCYQSMFEDCTSLINAPELLAQSTSGHKEYAFMFKGCEKVNKIVCLSSYSSASVTSWLESVAATGVFIKRADVNWPTGVDGVPEGWTVQDYAG